MSFSPPVHLATLTSTSVRELRTATGTGDDQISSTQTRLDLPTRRATLHTHEVIAEGRALTSALAVVEVGACPTSARLYCASYLQAHEIATVEDLLIDAALRKICGEHRREHNPTELEADETDEHAFHEGAARWMQWACGVWVSFDGSEARPSHRSELNRMALSQWLLAIGQLQTGNPIEAQRFFRRAVTLGGLYGTVSNPAIQWTYAASFFPSNG